MKSIGILGVTGLVGRTMLALLEERGFPVETPRVLAGASTLARQVAWRGRTLPVEPARPGCFDSLDVVLFATANDVSRTWAEEARRSRAQVVDNSSAFRYDDDVPLVVPEINGGLLDGRPPLVANPNCSTIGIVMALAPLLALADLRRLRVSTYQSVSGGGADLLDRFEREARAGIDGRRGEASTEPRPLAFNVIPHIDRFESNGYTREEMKVVWETRKILALPDLPVSATAVRVPVRVGHCAAVTATFAAPVLPDDARAAWSAFPGVEVRDQPSSGLYPSPLEAEGGDSVLVGRARVDLAEANTLSFFVASDNLRKGAALNAVQIAERLCASPHAAGAR
jgi:aspartate-semialdehyde dehydrogenase